MDTDQLIHLSALVLVRGFLKPIGWEMLLLVLYSPAFLPALALIVQVRRMTLRRRDFTAVTSRIDVLVVAQWVTLAFTLWSP